MRKILVVIALAALVLTIGCSKKEETAATPAQPVKTAAPAAPVMPEFSADSVTVAGPTTMNGKWYWSKNKMRMDTGTTSITIIDMAQKKGWTVMPQMKMYTEFDLSKQPTQAPTAGANPCVTPEMKCKEVGKETVNGRSTTHWEVTSMAQGKPIVTQSWIDDKLKIPVKTEMPGGIRTELKNIQEGPQPDKLFELPTGYKKQNMSIGG